MFWAKSMALRSMSAMRIPSAPAGNRSTRAPHQGQISWRSHHRPRQCFLSVYRHHRRVKARSEINSSSETYSFQKPLPLDAQLLMTLLLAHLCGDKSDPPSPLSDSSGSWPPLSHYTATGNQFHPDAMETVAIQPHGSAPPARIRYTSTTAADSPNNSKPPTSHKACPRPPSRNPLDHPPQSPLNMRGI
jgi:hypothetical protein